MKYIDAIIERQQRIASHVKDASRYAIPSPRNFAYAASKDMLGYADSGSTLIGQVEPEIMAATFVVSTVDQDRDGDVVMPSGINLENYSKNPVWFFGHQQWEIPIGSAVHPLTGEMSVKAVGDKVLATCYFDAGDPDAVFLFGKVQRGILRATSIGFVPLQAERIKLKAHPEFDGDNIAGYRFDAIDLIEISIVGVPANPNAMRMSLEREKRKLSGRLQKCLEPWCRQTACYFLPTMKCGGEGGTPGPCAENKPDSKPIGNLHATADTKAQTLLSRAKELPAKVYAAAKAKLQQHYAKLEKRYGKKTAIAIMAAGIVGTAVPLPGATMLATAPLIGAAELYKAMRGKAVVVAVTKEIELSEDEIKEAAKAFFAELLAEWQKETGYKPDNEEGKSMSKKWKNAKPVKKEEEKPAEETKPDQVEEKDDGGAVQAVILSPDKYADEAAAKQWLEANGYDASQFSRDDEEGGWVAVQFDSGKCEADTAVREPGEEGVTLVKCMEAAETKAEGEDDTEEEEKPEEKSKSKKSACACKQKRTKAEGGMEPTPLDEEPPAPVKPGVAFLRAIESAFAEHGPMQENPALQKCMAKIAAECERVAGEYPDEEFNFSLEAAEVEEPAPESEAEPEMPESIVAHFRNGKTKRFSKAHAGVIKEAADDLQDLGGADDMPRKYRGNLKYHARELGSLLTSDMPNGEDTDEDETEVKKLDFEAINKALEGAGDKFYALTGKRI